MQSQIKDPNRPQKMSLFTAAKWIYKQGGINAFYKGVAPRIMLSVYLTTCMVFGGDSIKKWVAENYK